MACISPDGVLTEQATQVLRLLLPGRTLEALAEEGGLPLYRLRSSARELMQAGLVEEADGTYRTTAAGQAKLG
jgi:hypothetical protein